MMHRKALEVANPRSDDGLLPSLLGNVAVIVLVFSLLDVPALRYHVIVMLIGQCFHGVFSPFGPSITIATASFTLPGRYEAGSKTSCRTACFSTSSTICFRRCRRATSPDSPSDSIRRLPNCKREAGVLSRQLEKSGSMLVSADGLGILVMLYLPSRHRLSFEVYP